MTTTSSATPTPPLAAGHAARRWSGGGALPARLWRGRPDDPSWARPALFGLLLATAALYLWNLSASGYGNSFYSAAVQAGSRSWKALFFGSLDAGNAITVDKPPAALWPMALSVRIFGLGSWAVLVPQVLMGVATVGVLYAAVRRRFSPAAGLIAGAVLALTPVAALMFRFNNPDALLTLLMTVTVYCVLRALEHGRTKWLVWAGVAVGLAFLTKTLQAFLVLPPLAVLYAVCAPVPLRGRLGQLALSGLVTVVCGGWWVAVVELWPASSRPYIGGSQNNSFLELTFGYNGLGRINGEETGSVGGRGGRGGGGGGPQWGETGIGRMFDAQVGSQVAWLLPAALVMLMAGLVLTRSARRTDTARGAFVAWGGALLMTAAVFSFMAGIFHQYYTVALAPYIAALIGMGATVLWEERASRWAGAVLGATVAGTVVWAYVLLGRAPDHLPWLRWAVLVAGIAGAAGLLFAGRLGRRLALATVGLSVAASVAGPVAYTLSTVGSSHTGSIVTAGPGSAGRMGPGGGAGSGPVGGGPGGAGAGTRQPGQNAGQGGGTGQPPTRPAKGGAGQGRQTVPPQDGRTGGFPDGGMIRENGKGGGMGGLLDGARVSAGAKKLVEADAGDYTWAAAAIGSQNAASYQLATGDPVMAIGGFNGSDPSPTLARFKRYVADGEIHYFIVGGVGGAGGDGTASGIASWVESTFKKVTVGNATFYDLTQPKK
ncbi:glycosyltransferase family 39 protein [Streptomyces sp. NPDC003032]